MFAPRPPEEVLETVRRLRKEGASTFLVGGALRDGLLAREIRDWDVATSAPLSTISALFSHVIPTGARHGTLTVRIGGRAIEVSTFRGPDILADLSLRDFTINALAYDPLDKRWLDPCGGIPDARAGLIRGVLDPLARFREDPLRVLRAVRISAELGFRIHPLTRRAIPVAAPALAHVARERIREELTRILLTEAPSKPLGFLRGTGILDEVIPELMEGHRRRHPASSHRCTILEHAFRTVDHLEAAPVLRWAGLLHDVAKPGCGKRAGRTFFFPDHEEKGARLAGAILRRLRFSQQEIRRITHLILHHGFDEAEANAGEAGLRGFVLRVGPESVLDLLQLRLADRMAVAGETGSAGTLEPLERKVRSLLRGGVLPGLRPVLDGGDVMRIMGVPPGPQVGEILERLRDAVIREPEINTRERLTRWLSEESGRLRH